MVKRKKVRAYIARFFAGQDTSTADAAGHSIHKAYSGYVHAASPQIMEMIGGDPPKFVLSGVDESTRMREAIADAWNYFYRGLLSVTCVGKAFGHKSVVDKMYLYIAEFERDCGTKYFQDSHNDKS
jgi:hypothetical protein